MGKEHAPHRPSPTGRSPPPGHQLVESTKGVVGTPYFMAPEVMGQQHYGPTADVWSVGCVALQMATGQPPWRGLGFKSPMQLYEFVKSNPKTIPNLPHGASEVSVCVHPHPEP